MKIINLYLLRRELKNILQVTLSLSLDKLEN